MNNVVLNYKVQEFINKAKVGDEITVSDNGNTATIVSFDLPNLAVYVVWKHFLDATCPYNIEHVVLHWEINSK